MKKVLFFLLFPFLLSAQTFEYGIITNVVQRGQLGNTTCWAASLEMLASAYKKPKEVNDLQLKYIRDKTRTPKEKGCTTYKNCPESIINKVGIFPIDSLLKVLTLEHNSFNIFASNEFLEKRKDNKVLADVEKNNNLNWIQIKKNFRGENPSPILLWREFGDINNETYHITTAIGYFEVKIANNNSTKFLLINDPWVKKLDSVGTHYLVNYDQFMQTSNDERAKIFMYGFKSINASNLKIKLSKDTLTNLGTFSYKKKFLQRESIAAKKLAEANVLNILQEKFLAEKEISRFFGSNISLDLKLGKSRKVTRIKDKNYSSFSDFRNELLASTDQELFTITKSEKDTCFVYVTSKEKNAPKFTALSQRIEPYETSISKVLNDVQEKLKDTTSSRPIAKSNTVEPKLSSSLAQNSLPSFDFTALNNPKQYLNFQFDNVFMFKTFNSKPDFLLIPKQSSLPTSFILIDLFDKMKDQFKILKIKELPSISGFENPIKLPNFNYKLYSLDYTSFDTLLAIFNQK
jgi:hypothetical protein